MTTTQAPFKSADETASAVDAVNITPSDVSTLANGTALALFIGAAGNVTLITAEGNSALFVGILAGSILPVRTNKVMATGTTASAIVALY